MNLFKNIENEISRVTKRVERQGERSFVDARDYLSTPEGMAVVQGVANTLTPILGKFGPYGWLASLLVNALSSAAVGAVGLHGMKEGTVTREQYLAITGLDPVTVDWPNEEQRYAFTLAQTQLAALGRAGMPFARFMRDERLRDVY